MKVCEMKTIDQMMDEKDYGVRNIDIALRVKIGREMDTRKIDTDQACRLVLGNLRERIPTPASIRRAFATAEEIIVDTGDNRMMPSSVLNHIFGEIGKHVKFYRSDIMYDIGHIMKAIRTIGPGESCIQVLGLRTCGIDGNDFFLRWMDDAVRPGQIYDCSRYNKVLAVRIAMIDYRVEVSLRELDYVRM